MTENEEKAVRIIEQEGEAVLEELVIKLSVARKALEYYAQTSISARAVEALQKL
jgi:hypothetical protein